MKTLVSALLAVWFCVVVVFIMLIYPQNNDMYKEAELRKQAFADVSMYCLDLPELGIFHTKEPVSYTDLNNALFIIRHCINKVADVESLSPYTESEGIIITNADQSIVSAARSYSNIRLSCLTRDGDGAESCSK